MVMERPKGAVAKWSQTSARRWIVNQVKLGHFKMSDHGKNDSGPLRDISEDEAVTAVLKAQRTKFWEPGETKISRKPTMTLRFVHEMNTRTIEVVTSIQNDQSIVVFATVIAGPPK